MTYRPLLGVMLALSLGCQLQPVPGSTPIALSRSPKPKASPSIAIGTQGRPIPLSEPPRLIDSNSPVAELIGKVKLVSKVKIISDNGASIVTNGGANVISNNGGGIISDNGASLIGKTKYALAQLGGTAALEEVLLADAQVEVLDAAGRVLVGADQKPLTATTDKTGSYSFKAPLPSENLVLRIRLFNGGQLFAFTTRDKRTGAQTVDIDTASSLGAIYVLRRYVNQSQAVLNLLPGLESDKLRADMEQARVHLGDTALAYQPEELIQAVDQLRDKAPTLDATIERIETLLLAGQKELGTGLKATQVALAAPGSVTSDGKGTFYIAESTAGRIRKVAPDGTVSVFAGPGAEPGRDTSLGVVLHMVLGPDGNLYCTRKHHNTIVKIPPTGPWTAIAGDGKGPSTVGSPAATARFDRLGQLTFSPAGVLHFTEGAKRLLFLDAEGRIQEVARPAGADCTAATFAADGTLWLADFDASLAIYRRAPGADWTRVVPVTTDAVVPSEVNVLLPGPDGTLLFAAQQSHRIFRVTAAGALSPVAGNGEAGYAGDGGPAATARLNTPSGLWLASDGTLYVSDSGNGLVRAVDPTGTIQTVAGTRGVTQVGDALAISMSQPGGVELDAEGRILVTETAGHTVKRLDGTAITLLAGSNLGFSGDGGSASQATFKGPTGLAYHQGALYVADSGNERIRKIDAAGVITTVVGGAKTSELVDRAAPLETNLYQPLDVAFSPDGVLYWTENWYNRHVVRRLKDGVVELVAGTIGATGQDGGDGGPATQAKLNLPFGLAFDTEGNLYVADTGNLRIRKIDKAGVITTYAGLPMAGAIGQLGAPNAKEQLPLANRTPARETILWGPTGLAFDDQGNLLFSEVGANNLDAFGESDFSTIKPLLPPVPGRIRKVTPQGEVVNVTGPGTTLLSKGTGDEMLIYPFGLVFDAKNRRLIIADSALNQVKVIKGGL